MSQQVDPPPLTIPPPGPVKAAGALVAGEGLGLVGIAVATVVSGLEGDTGIGQLIAQAGYFVVLAVFLGAVAIALLRGRRWGRSPAIVVQIIAGAIGLWLAFPSDRLAVGLAVTLLAVLAGYLLLSKPATAWISQFPPMFGPEH